MNQYVYSATTNVFYPLSMQSLYESAETWPDDAVEVSDDIVNEYTTDRRSEGKIRAPGDDGCPIWSDIPLPSHEEYVAIAKQQKKDLALTASAAIAPLQDAESLDIATSDELTKLNEWRKYRVLLNRIDINAVPNIEWPKTPD